MFAGKPIIGIMGGIGSGKSYIATLFGELGCLVIDSDQQVRQAYRDPTIQQTLRQWWGDEVFDTAGDISRRAIAKRVFSDPADRQRLESLLHPWVAQARDREMASVAADAQVRAFVWDTPLLVENGLNSHCDALVFVDAPLELRASRVAASRGWKGGELALREKLQTPLDKKRQIADYVIVNTAEANDVAGVNAGNQVRDQVREVLSRILARSLSPSTGAKARAGSQG